MLLMILFMALMFNVIRIGLKMTWGVLRILMGVGLFALCPVLFIAAMFLGIFGHGLVFWILLVFALGWGFRRTV